MPADLGRAQLATERQPKVHTVALQLKTGCHLGMANRGAEAENRYDERDEWTFGLVSVLTHERPRRWRCQRQKTDTTLQTVARYLMGVGMDDTRRNSVAVHHGPSTRFRSLRMTVV